MNPKPIAYVTRESLATRIHRAAKAQNVTVHAESSTDGRIGYVLNGTWVTPGEAADLLLGTER